MALPRAFRSYTDQLSSDSVDPQTAIVRSVTGAASAPILTVYERDAAGSKLATFDMAGDASSIKRFHSREVAVGNRQGDTFAAAFEDGWLFIAYTSLTKKRLRLKYQPIEDSPSPRLDWELDTIEPEADVPARRQAFPSLAAASALQVGISYTVNAPTDGGERELWFAEGLRADSTGAFEWTRSKVASVGQGTKNSLVWTGAVWALAFETDSAIMLALGEPGSWLHSPITGPAEIAAHAGFSLAIYEGRLAIALVRDLAGQGKRSRRLDFRRAVTMPEAGPQLWQTVPIVPDGLPGVMPVLKIDDDVPSIVYYNTELRAVCLAEATRKNPSTTADWATQAVHTVAEPQKGVSALSFGFAFANAPVLAFWEFDRNTRDSNGIITGTLHYYTGTP